MPDVACHVHRWVDRGAFFSDDELRKQAGLLVGTMIVPGQESQEAESRMRNDMFTRHSCACLTAFRLSLSVLTKMVGLTGWKRFAMHEFLRSRGTTERSFMSMLCRSLVLKLDHHKRGQVR